MRDALPQRQQPAHRPSRRADIIDGAIRQFARRGWVDTLVADIAADADVAVTAVYYHFSGKEELFAAAVGHSLDSLGAVIVATRNRRDGPPAQASVIDTARAWINSNPDAAALLYQQLPAAAHPIATMRRVFEDTAALRAFGCRADDDAASGRTCVDDPERARLADALATRTLVDLLLSVHTTRLAGDPLSLEPSEHVSQATRTVAHRLMSA